MLRIQQIELILEESRGGPRAPGRQLARIEIYAVLLALALDHTPDCAAKAWGFNAAQIDDAVDLHSQALAEDLTRRFAASASAPEPALREAGQRSAMATETSLEAVRSLVCLGTAGAPSEASLPPSRPRYSLEAEAGLLNEAERIWAPRLKRVPERDRDDLRQALRVKLLDALRKDQVPAQAEDRKRYVHAMFRNERTNLWRQQRRSVGGAHALTPAIATVEIERHCARRLVAMTPRDAIVLALRYLELSEATIASLLGLTRQQVRLAWQRGLKQLRQTGRGPCSCDFPAFSTSSRAGGVVREDSG